MGWAAPAGTQVGVVFGLIVYRHGVGALFRDVDLVLGDHDAFSWRDCGARRTNQSFTPPSGPERRDPTP